MSEFDFEYTLFHSAENETGTPYELQISTESFAGEYKSGDYTIVSSPGNSSGILGIQLKLLPGNETVLIHDFPLDILRTTEYTPDWEIHVEYVDDSDTPLGDKKKKNKQQAKIESTPRPHKAESVT